MVDAFVVVAVGTVVVLLAVSAFFSSTEIAVFSLSPEAVRERAASGDRRATTLAELQPNPHRLLVTILVGNNVVNVAVSSIVTVLLVTVVPEELAVLATTLVASSVVLVFGEIVPKSYGLGHAESWALTAARPLRVVELLLYPLVAVFDALTRRLGAALGGQGDIERSYLDE